MAKMRFTLRPIEITNNFSLDTNQQLSLLGRSNVVVNGNYHTISETSARYSSLGASNSHIMRIESASNIYINDLSFTSPAVNSQCRNGGMYYNSDPCSAIIAIIDSINVFIDEANINTHKTMNIGIASSHNVEVTNSDLRSAAAFNIWIGGSSQNTDIDVTDNYISDAGANGILVSHTDGIWVGNNTFEGNHWDTQYFGYGGGQILLETHGQGNLEWVDITGNILTAGASAYSYGIEVAAFENSVLNKATIIWNRIEGHPYPAIYFIPRVSTSDIRHVTINNNELIDNATPPGQVKVNSHANIDLTGYYNRSGGTTSTDDFNGTAKTCSLNGGSQCSINIQWASTNISSPNIYVRSPAYGSTRSLFASGVSGIQNASWITTSGAIFELVSGTSTHPVAVINVKAVP